MGECTVNTDLSRFRCDSGVNRKNCFFVSNLSLDNSIKRFWELEAVDPPKLSCRKWSCVVKTKCRLIFVELLRVG